MLCPHAARVGAEHRLRIDPASAELGPYIGRASADSAEPRPNIGPTLAKQWSNARQTDRPDVGHGSAGHPPAFACALGARAEPRASNQRPR
eukprot:1384166-Lingulodinium_polyedra.AAC.1